MAWTTPEYFIVILTLVARVSCQKGSLTFVIDDTGSMDDDIAQVIHEVDNIMDVVLDARASQIDNIILVAFNDAPIKPRLLANILIRNTRSREIFRRTLNEIKVDWGGDCPEQSLSGIKMALESSLPGSYLYVFTDASANDYHMVEEIKQLCQRKQSRVVFVLTGDCGVPNSQGYQVYHEIAIATSGMAFKVEKNEVGMLINAIKEDIRGNKTVLTGKITEAGYYTDVPFTIDDLTESVTISVSGENVQEVTLKGQDCKIEKIVNLANVKVTKMLNPYPGKYFARVGSAYTKTSVLINANTDVLFKHGFSQQEPKSIDDTAPQPFSDTVSHLSIFVTDPRSSFRIESAVIMDMNENTLQTLPLKELWPNFYTTESFKAPSYMFKVGVLGKSVKTGRTIRRIATIPVTPQEPPPGTPVAKEPVVTIKEGTSIDVAAGNEVILTCKVSAYPKPEITWRDDRGLVLKSNTSIIQIPYDYISYLRIPQVSSHDRYYCHARNFMKSNFEYIDVIPKNPFTFLTITSGTKKIQYGSEFTLNCNVRSDQPFQIRWYHVNPLTRETDQITSSEKYSITSDSSKLTIRYMDTDLVGKYTCKVYLSKDPTQKQEFNTNVEIYGMEKPVIDPKKTGIKVMENEPATISCKIIKGVPKPKISWMFKVVGAKKYTVLSGSESELRIKNAALTDAGDYKCVAENTQGSTEQVVAELVVLKKPAITIVQGTTLTIPYGSQLTLTCRVKASPEASVKWYNNAGNALHSTSIATTDKYEQIHSMSTRAAVSGDYRYRCVAVNDLGSMNKTVQVTVSSPFKILSHPTGIVQAKYGTNVNLKCEVTSEMPMKIRWYHTKDSGSKQKEINSSHKYLITSNGKELNINSMDIGLDGKYTCVATMSDNNNEHDELTRQVELIGLEPPVIKREVDKVALMGTSVSINCNVIKGSPPPTISWQFMGRNESQYKNLKNTNNMLSISKVTNEHFGSYKCIAKNIQGADEHNIALTVEEPARITTSTSVVYEALQGDVALRIPCEVTGYPKPNVTWMMEHSIIPSSPKYVILDGALVIKDPVTNDSGLYICKASNHVGSDTKAFEGTVHETVPDDGKRVELNILKGSTDKLKCNLPRAESASVSWYIGGVDINRHDIYIELAGDGNYTCHVSDILGSATETYEVIFGFTPQFTFPAPRDVKWYGDTEDVLNCSVDAVPEPKIDWTFNGEHLVGKNSTFQLEIPKEGHYECVVSNVHGSIQREFDVKLETE